MTTVTNATPSGVIHVTTGGSDTAERIVGDMDVTIPLSGLAVQIAVSLAESMNAFGVPKSCTARIRRDNIAGQILATNVFPGDAGDGVGGNQHIWNTTFIDSVATTGRYVVTLQNTVAANPADIWSATHSITLTAPVTDLSLPSSRPITVDGVPLQSYCTNIITRDGWDYFAGHRSSNPKVPGRTGSLYDPYKQRDEGRMVLQMWVSAQNADGSYTGSDRYAAWKHNLDQLMLLFQKPAGLLTVVRCIGPSEFRQAQCEATAAIVPTYPAQVQDPITPLTVELTIPDGYWMKYPAAGSRFAYTFSATALPSAVLPLPGTAGMTGTIEDPIVRVYGPVANPSVQNFESGYRVSLQAVTLTSDQYWQISGDTGDSRIYTISTGTFVDAQLSTVTSGPGALLFGIGPKLSANGGVSTVQLQGTSPGSQTALYVQGDPRFR